MGYRLLALLIVRPPNIVPIANSHQPVVIHPLRGSFLPFDFCLLPLLGLHLARSVEPFSNYG